MRTSQQWFTWLSVVGVLCSLASGYGQQLSFEGVWTASRTVLVAFAGPGAVHLLALAVEQRRLAHGFTNVRLIRRITLMRYPLPPAETVEFFREYYGPTQKAFAALDSNAQDALRRDLVELQTAKDIA
jgi:hypothetical protein